MERGYLVNWSVVCQLVQSDAVSHGCFYSAQVVSVGWRRRPPSLRRVRDELERISRLSKAPLRLRSPMVPLNRSKHVDHHYIVYIG